MIGSLFEGVRISAIVTSVPENKNNIIEDYSNVFGKQEVEKFVLTTGVVERRIADANQTAGDLAFDATMHLLKEKGIVQGAIGVCVFVTQTPDYRMPSTACVLHKRIGLPMDCICFDVNLGCSGFVYGLQVVCSLVKSTGCQYALLLIGDTLNKYISDEDRALTMIFGDAGSAILVENTKNKNDIIETVLRTDGNHFKSIIIPAGSSRNRDSLDERVVWGDENKRSDYELYMDGLDVFNFTIHEVPDLIHEYIEEKSYSIDQFDAFVFHQANEMILKKLMKKLKIPKEKVPMSCNKYGNTSGVSIPLTLCDTYGTELDGSVNVLSSGFGIGLSWGIACFSVDKNSIFPIYETSDCFEDGKVDHD